MRVPRSFRLSLAVPVLAVSSLAAAGAAAQFQSPMVQPLNPDADQLAAEMRLLATDPLDVGALVRAGELALKLGDETAAAAFFARADRLDQRNPRIKAGLGSLLVQSEKPGEALRRFAEAEALGLDPKRFIADRGLAYDLIGDQERAQRDYRLALKDSPNDETVRRYALSLGISGKGDLAYAHLEPLLRRSDRGAWRARAFILAMTGDASGAERIATNMMPPGLAQGLQPFFDRLPSLGPVDRAFAVHFGELRATPERIADARLIPPLTPLRPEPGLPQPVAVAQVAPKPERQDDRRGRNKNKKKTIQPEPVRVATAPPPVPLPQPPVYVARVEPMEQPPYMPPSASPVRTLSSSRETMVMNPAGVTGTAPNRTPVFSRAPVSAPAFGAATSSSGSTSSPRVMNPASVTGTVPNRAPNSGPPASTPAFAAATPSPGIASSAQVTNPASVTGAAPNRAPVSGPPASTPTFVAAAPLPNVPAPSQGRTPAAQVGPGFSDSSASQPTSFAPATRQEPGGAPAGVTPSAFDSHRPDASGPASATLPTETATTPSAPTPAPAPMRNEDAILANIIASVSGPEGSDAPPSVEPEPAPAIVTPPPASVEPKVDDAAAQAKAAAEAKAAADRKALADKKAAEAKKLADTKKLADAKKAAELKKKNDPRILEPARIWVQVAGGANEGTLPKEWAKVRDKAPAAFKGKSGWTTPLRATNRVLAGPFKTNEEARAFVNALSKEGLSTFVFTSEAGQKITKLPAK